jgi:transposase-like protein
MRGVKLVISDAHEGLKAAITKVLSATWQRCRVHFMRNALAHAGKTQRRIVSAWIGTAFAQDDAEAARKQWRQVADQARPRISRLATLMDDAEADVLAYMGFPAQHRTKIHSTDALDKRVCVCRGTELSHHHRSCAILIGGLFFVLGCSCQAATNLL